MVKRLCLVLFVLTFVKLSSFHHAFELNWQKEPWEWLFHWPVCPPESDASQPEPEPKNIHRRSWNQRIPACDSWKTQNISCDIRPSCSLPWVLWHVFLFWPSCVHQGQLPSPQLCRDDKWTNLPEKRIRPILGCRDINRRLNRTIITKKKVLTTSPLLGRF